MINLSQEEILAIYLSLKIAFTASLVSLPLAIFLGYLFARKEFFFKKFFISLLNLPLVLPPVVTGYILLIVFGILPEDKFLVLIISGFLFKVIVALLDTPLLYLFVWIFRKKFNLKVGEEIKLS